MHDHARNHDHHPGHEVDGGRGHSHRLSVDADRRYLTIALLLIVGFMAFEVVAGIIARILSPGPNNPSGFILTTILGILGAFLATWIGQAIGHYSADQGAGFMTATIGALVVLFILNRVVARGAIPDWNK